LEARHDGQVVELRGSKRRAVLAILVLHANEVVRADRLIEEVWGEHRPTNASAALQNHISRLRKDLGAEVLVTKPWGYVLRAGPDDVDLFRFERLLAEARALPARERADLLAEALALWRGPALADLANEPALVLEIGRLEDLRLSALEQRIDADLELGRHEELIPELEALIAQQPLRERLRGQLILALYRSGRQAEALETYRETRRVLVEELGIEPSAELRELERSILRQDPALVAAPAPVAVVEAEAPAASKWSWPRSPLVAAVLLLLLAGAGAAGAVLALHEGSSPGSTEVAEDSQPVAVTTRVVFRSTARPKRTTSPRPRTARSSHRAAAAAPQPARSGTTSRPVKRTSHAAAAPKQKSTRSKTPSKRSQTADTRPFVLSDDFDTAAFDFRIWHRAFVGSGWDVAQRNGRLEIGLAADSVLEGPYNMVEAHYGANCRLVGDFDMRVDFRLLTWPQESGAVLTLAAWRTTAASVVVSRFAYAGGEGYAADLPLPPVVGPGVNSIRRPSVDDAGALRLRRRNDFVTAYYRRAGRWEAFGGAPYLGNVLIALQLSAGSEFAHQAVRVAFDNFTAVADDVSCPNGVAKPPRQPRP
jgi:DNA-binding SARP family transcriptional activator